MTTAELNIRWYHRANTDRALVLLHGFPFDATMWDGVGQELSEILGPEVSVLAFDLPGFGGSAAVLDDPAAQNPSLNFSADLVAQQLAVAGISRAVFAGLSMGGYVALALLERHPELFAAVALLDTKARSDDDAARHRRLEVAQRVLDTESLDAVLPMSATLLAPARRDDEELIGQLRATISSQPTKAIVWTQRAMADRPDRSALLTELTLPALVLVGAQDEVTPISAANEMIKHLQHSPQAEVTLVVVADAGHLTAVEQPAEVARILGAFSTGVLS